MECPQCATEMEVASNFCPNCGFRVTDRPVDSEVLFSGPTSVSTPTQSGDKDLHKGERFADRYVIERRIGGGGMGAVYLARDEMAGEMVCLKVIRPVLLTNRDLTQRFLREGALTRKIRHRNVVSVYDLGRYQGRCFLSMEYIEGRSLRAWLWENRKTARTVPLDVAKRILAEILEGLAEAHGLGVVHRDLKPENVMLLGEPLDGDFRVKLLDFGIARALVPGQHITTQAGASIGTPIYMAPEQATGAEIAGPEADLYSVAVLFYEILLDVPPQGRWELPSDVRPDLSSDVDHFFRVNLSQHPRRRLQTCAEFAEALNGLGDDLVDLDRMQPGITPTPELGLPVMPPVRDAEPDDDVVVTPAIEVVNEIPVLPPLHVQEVYRSGEHELHRQLLARPEWLPAESLVNEQGMLTAVHALTGLAFVLVPGGSFVMGAEEGEETCPIHEVSVTPFLICATPCTQGAWDQLGGHDQREWLGSDLPIEGVSWNDVCEWCDRAGGGLRLPSEAEWEYACRAGTASPFFFGENVEAMESHGWSYSTGSRSTQAVAQKLPNSWGLFDVHGNVGEWCQDRAHSDYSGAPTTGAAWESGESPLRIHRGGGWTYWSDGCNSVHRDWSSPDHRYGALGFRPAASVPDLL